VDERTFRPWAVAAGLWAVFFVREQKKGVGCVFRSGRRQALHRAALPTRCSARIRTGNSVPLIKSVVSRVEPEGTSAGLPFAYHFFLRSSLVSFIDGREHNCLHEKCCDSMATIVDEKLKSKNFKPQM